MKPSAGDRSDSPEKVDGIDLTAPKKDVPQQSPEVAVDGKSGLDEGVNAHQGVRFIIVLLCLFLGNFNIGFVRGSQSGQ